jgi:hypothetical protein
VEAIGLVSQLSPENVEKILPARLSQWPRSSHDRAVRQLSATPPEERARLLLAIYDSLDALIRPLAIDEMGMSGQANGIPKLIELVQNDETPGFTRLKAIEALGRLRASGSSPLFQHLLETRQVWRWVYPNELRIAAAQALLRVEPTMGMEKIAASGIDRKELTLEPTDPEANASVIRQRRYARLKLARNLIAVTTNLRQWHSNSLTWIWLNATACENYCWSWVDYRWLLRSRIAPGVADAWRWRRARSARADFFTTRTPLPTCTSSTCARTTGQGIDPSYWWLDRRDT